MDELHEVHFTWPDVSPNTVIVTGTFDEWSSSVHLVKNETGFHGSTRIPWDTKITFKYIVDSSWVCETTSPTETDASGNVNNVYVSPSPPKPPLVDPVESTVVDPTTVTNGAVAAATEKVDAPTAPEVAEAPSEAKHVDTAPIVNDLANTVAARDGTSSAFEYVTSALGAAINGQIGVDPINSEKIAVETPKPDAQSIVPESQVAETSPVAAPEPALITPVVAMQIVPVNNGENNTSSTATPAAEVAPVAPDVPLSGISAPLEAPPAAPVSESAETLSTHSPLPAVIPTPESTPTVEIAAPPLPTGATSEPAVIVDNASQNAETPAPSEPPVPAIPEPTAAVSETTAVPAETAPTVPAVTNVLPVAMSTAEPAFVNGAPPTSASAINSSPSTPVITPTPSAPATPAKNTQHAFPSAETESPSSNNSSPSKFGTMGSRKNRKSIFGKIKGIFGSDKEEKEKK